MNERRFHVIVGGGCSFCACMPSKGLLRPVEPLRARRAVAGEEIPAALRQHGVGILTGPATDALGLATVCLDPGAHLPADDTMRLEGHDRLLRSA